MNAVQEIKARNDEREWADIEAILRAIQPALKRKRRAPPGGGGTESTGGPTPAGGRKRPHRTAEYGPVQSRHPVPGAVMGPVYRLCHRCGQQWNVSTA